MIRRLAATSLAFVVLGCVGLSWPQDAEAKPGWKKSHGFFHHDNGRHLGWYKNHHPGWHRNAWRDARIMNFGWSDRVVHPYYYQTHSYPIYWSW